MKTMFLSEALRCSAFTLSSFHTLTNVLFQCLSPSQTKGKEGGGFKREGKVFFPLCYSIPFLVCEAPNGSFTSRRNLLHSYSQRKLVLCVSGGWGKNNVCVHMSYVYTSSYVRYREREGGNICSGSTLKITLKFLKVFLCMNPCRFYTRCSLYCQIRYWSLNIKASSALQPKQTSAPSPHLTPPSLAHLICSIAPLPPIKNVMMAGKLRERCCSWRFRGLKWF